MARLQRASLCACWGSPRPPTAAAAAAGGGGREAFPAQGFLTAPFLFLFRALEAAVSLGGEGLTPFYSLVSGGREGKFYRVIVL